MFEMKGTGERYSEGTGQMLRRLAQDGRLSDGLKPEIEKLLVQQEKELKLQERILRQSDRQQRQLQELHDELEAYKNELEARVRTETAKRMQHEKMLEQQSKMAAMGEMMDAVAHQWKQPLNALSMIIEMLQSDFRSGAVDAAYIDERCMLANDQITHMITTLEAFRAFFRPNRSAAVFGLKPCIDAVLLLMRDELTRCRITVEQQATEAVTLRGIENEFKHLLLNIINNAKDAFAEREVAQRNITIRCTADTRATVIDIEDNAGGIPQEVIGTLFKPNVTTKAEGKGTGIGLYMSSQIAEKMGGTLTVANTQTGARFTLRLPADAGQAEQA